MASTADCMTKEAPSVQSETRINLALRAITRDWTRMRERIGLARETHSMVLSEIAESLEKLRERLRLVFRESMEDADVDNAQDPRDRPMARFPRHLLATLEIASGVVKEGRNQPAEIQIDSLEEWYNEVQSTINEINREIAEGVAILGHGSSRRPVSDPVDEATVKALGELITERTRGRIHLLPVAPRLNSLLEKIAD